MVRPAARPLAADSQKAGRRRWLAFFASAVLVASVSVGTFRPVLEYGFVNWDDPEYLTENPHLDQPLLEFVRWSVSTTRMGNWHPLTWLSLRFDDQRGGGQARAFHLTSLALHSINSVLVVVATTLLLGHSSRPNRRPSATAAFFVGALFAVHPLHVESVAWISERKDVLFALFWLLSLISYLAYLERSPRARRIGYVASLAFFLASLASKPMAIVLVPVLFLLDFWPYGRHRLRSWGSLLAEKLPFLLASVAVIAVTLVGQRAVGALSSMEQLNALSRGIRLFWNLGFYLTQSLAPHHLTPLHALNQSLAPSMAEAIGISTFVVWCALGWRFRHRAPGLGWGALAFVALLAPILGVVQAGSQATADRYAYLAVGIPIALVVQLSVAVDRRFRISRPILLLFGVLSLTLLVAHTRGQIRHWSSTPSLWARVLEFAPAHPTALYNLGQNALSEGDLALARRYWEAAIESRPDHSQAQNQLGNLALMAGDLTAAEGRYRSAVRADPRNVEAIYNLAITLDREAKAEEAARWLEQFLAAAGSEYSNQRAWAEARLSDLRGKSDSRPLP